jgi:Concanavalin A-like lectin/glucanases superfamily/PEP-CTERM motif
LLGLFRTIVKILKTYQNYYMKIKNSKSLAAIAVVALSSALAPQASAVVTTYASYALGEAGSIAVVGGVNEPQDSLNLHDFSTVLGVGTSTVVTGVSGAPGSTAYITSAGARGWTTGTTYTSGLALATDNFGFSVWTRAAANTSGAGGTQGTVFGLGGPSVTGPFQIALTATGWQASSFNVGNIGTAGAFVANEWINLAVIRSGGVSTFYVNGVASGATFAGAPQHASGHLSVTPGGSDFFYGDIDEARIVTFTAGETTANVLGGLGAIPEPSSALLGGLGVLGLALRRRRNA